MNQNLTDLWPIFQWLVMSYYSTIVWLWALWDSNHCLLTYFDLYSWPTANRNLPDVPHKLCFLSVSFTYTATLVWFMSLGFHLAQAMELTFAKPFISQLWPHGVLYFRLKGHTAASRGSTHEIFCWPQKAQNVYSFWTPHSNLGHTAK